MTNLRRLSNSASRSTPASGGRKSPVRKEQGAYAPRSPGRSLLPFRFVAARSLIEQILYLVFVDLFDRFILHALRFLDLGDDLNESVQVGHFLHGSEDLFHRPRQG